MQSSSSVSTQTESTKLEDSLGRQLSTQFQELSILRAKLADALTEIKELRFERNWMAEQIRKLKIS